MRVHSRGKSLSPALGTPVTLGARTSPFGALVTTPILPISLPMSPPCHLSHPHPAPLSLAAP